jgi:hypothetical protein
MKTQDIVQILSGINKLFIYFHMQVAESMGFAYVASGPMVRSSYRAGELYISNVLRGKQDNKAMKETASV